MAESFATRKAPSNAKAIARLKRLLKKKRNDLGWHHEVGRLVAEIIPERAYGDNKMLELLKKLDRKLPDQTRLYEDRRLFLAYRDKNDLDQFEGLSYDHVKILLRHNDSVRRKLMTQCSKHGWSVRQLAARSKEKLGTQSRSGPRFTAKKYVGVHVGLGNIRRLPDRWEMECAPAFKTDLNTELARLSPDAAERFLELARDAHAALKKLRTALKQAEGRLRAVIKDAKRR